VVSFLGCWKWFNGVLKEAEVNVTDENKGKIDEVIHKYIGEQSSYGRCSADWRKARKEINASPEMRNELIEKLKALVYSTTRNATFTSFFPFLKKQTTETAQFRQ
jgi:hypothetical protein